MNLLRLELHGLRVRLRLLAAAAWARLACGILESRCKLQGFCSYPGGCPMLRVVGFATNLPCEGTLGHHRGPVRVRPKLEGGTRLLCDSCWDDYEQSVYEMWKGHVG